MIYFLLKEKRIKKKAWNLGVRDNGRDGFGADKEVNMIKIVI